MLSAGGMAHPVVPGEAAEGATLRGQLADWREKAHFFEGDRDRLRAQLAEERGRHQEMEREMLARGEVVFADLRAQLAEAQRCNANEAAVLVARGNDLHTIKQIAQGLADVFPPQARQVGVPFVFDLAELAKRLAKFDAYQKQQGTP
jgi:hypothetical protein